ncbi:hypothetical protein ACROYT_G021760 [Oculina patagonica]
MRNAIQGNDLKPLFPFLGCYPDGKVIDETEETPYGIMEIKPPYKHKTVTPEKKFMDAENGLYALQECIKRLELSKREKKVPSGMKIHRFKAKGKHTTLLQETFDGILREAEFKLLDATLAALHQDEQHCRDSCTEEKANISKAINTWREAFKASESSLSADADQFVASSKYFCDDYYFKCVGLGPPNVFRAILKRPIK